MTFTEQTPDPGHFVQWEGDMEADYVYTFGQAGERFFRALQEDGEILATECEDCGKRWLPPRIYCTECFEEVDGYVPVEGTATVAHATVSRLGLDGDELDEPTVYGLVTWDDVDGGILHELLVDPDEAEAGLEVTAVLKDAGDREGGIGDIEGFAAV